MELQEYVHGATTLRTHWTVVYYKWLHMLFITLFSSATEPCKQSNDIMVVIHTAIYSPNVSVCVCVCVCVSEGECVSE